MSITIGDGLTSVTFQTEEAPPPAGLQKVGKQKLFGDYEVSCTGT
jgi:hypothetical protein